MLHGSWGHSLSLCSLKQYFPIPPPHQTYRGEANSTKETLKSKLGSWDGQQPTSF